MGGEMKLDGKEIDPETITIKDMTVSLMHRLWDENKKLKDFIEEVNR